MAHVRIKWCNARTAEGKRERHKSDVGLGINFFKIIIPVEFVNKYDSHWLSFVRDLKNDEVVNKKEYLWKVEKNEILCHQIILFTKIKSTACMVLWKKLFDHLTMKHLLLPLN